MPKRDPHDERAWSDEKRVVTQQFLETILLDDTYSSRIHRRGVQIIGALFQDQIDLFHGDLDFPLLLAKSLFNKEVTFAYLKSESVSSFEGSSVAKTFNGTRLVTQGNLFLWNSACFNDINLCGARIGGEFAMNGASVTGTLHMGSLAVEGNFFMRRVYPG